MSFAPAIARKSKKNTILNGHFFFLPFPFAAGRGKLLADNNNNTPTKTVIRPIDRFAPQAKAKGT
jgi:hypothetical protein